MKSYEYALELLKEGQHVSFHAKGLSMLPSIKDNQLVYLKPYDLNKDRLYLYDIILCEVDGITMLHRIVELGDLIKVKGDNTNFYHEVTRNHIYGIYLNTSYAIRQYILKEKPLEISLPSIKRHNLEGLYQDERSLKKAYLMDIQAREVSRVLNVLKQSFENIILLKGYALASLYHDTPYFRVKGDLDLYVNQDHTHIGDILQRLGYNLKSKSIAHDVYFNGMLLIEVHKRLDSDFEIKHEMLDIDDVYGCYVLKPRYQVVYLMLHIKKHLNHGGIGYKHILDIYYLKDHIDHNLLYTYHVDSLYLYIDTLMEMILGHHVSHDILDKLILFASDIEAYGVHGSLHIRMSRIKDMKPLYKRYLGMNGFKRLIETLKHNDLRSIIKKLRLYMTSKKSHSRQLLYKELLS